MPSNDDRQITSGIAVKAPAPAKAGKAGGKRVTHVQRVLTAADHFDEIECHLTPEEVERLKEPDPTTGIPVLIGSWTGKATMEEYTDPKTGETRTQVVPADFEPPDDGSEEHKARRRGRKKAEE